MYTEKIYKETISRVIERPAKKSVQQSYKDGNSMKTALIPKQQITQLKSNNILQMAYYKVFEKDVNGPGPKIKKDTGYTTLGVRRNEVEEDPDGYIRSTKNMPQGMSLLSDEGNAETSTQYPQNNYGIFKLENNLYPNLLSILKDPSNKGHHLWGPLDKLKYKELDSQIKNSKNSWDLVAVYNGNEWEPKTIKEYRRKKNKNRRKIANR